MKQSVLSDLSDISGITNINNINTKKNYNINSYNPSQSKCTYYTLTRNGNIFLTKNNI